MLCKERREYLLSNRRIQTLSLELHKSFLFCFVFVFSRATGAAHGSSQARGLIRAVAAGLHQATAMRHPSRICNLHHSSQQRQFLNPLSEARDRTYNLMVPSWIH